MSDQELIVDISELQDVEGLCRVCLTESRSMFSLHNHLDAVYEDDVNTIHLLLQKLYCKPLTDDPKYPAYICSMCLSLSNIAHKFILQLELSQKQLNEYFSEDGESDSSPTNTEDANVAHVELISSKGKYSLQDLIIIEDDEDKDKENETNSMYDGFLRNLGTEVTANYVRGDTNKRIRLQEDEEYIVNVIALPRITEVESDSVEQEKDDAENLDVNFTLDKVKSDVTCTICDTPFPKKRLLDIHNKELHFKRREFLCQKCGHVAKTKSSLYNHLMLKHFEKKFVCKVCGKKYNSKSHLRYHEIVHKNERKHLCTVCGKTFNYANALQYHMRIHTGEKKYTCSYCSRGFTMQCGLSRHLRTHTGIRPYGCKFCDKAFRSKGEANCHEMTHTGVRPYTCKYCGKGFTKTHNLKVHMMAHSGPHVCEFCQRGFIEVAYLKMHMKVTHGLEDYGLNSNTVYYVSECDTFDDIGETVIYTSS